MQRVRENALALKERFWPAGMLRSIFAAISMPFVLLMSIPLATFAVVTTSIAFWILLARVSLVHVELFAVLLRAHLVPEDTPRHTSPTISPVKERSPKDGRLSRNELDDFGFEIRTTPHNASSATITPEPLPPRDYEGVGGWRVQEIDDDDDEDLWMNIGSRLELPSTPYRHHSRSQTSISRPPSGFTSPEGIRTPLALRPATPGRLRRGGGEPGSPEGYFNMPLTPAHVGDRGSKVSFEDQKTAGSSSTTSVGSVRVIRSEPT